MQISLHQALRKYLPGSWGLIKKRCGPGRSRYGPNTYRFIFCLDKLLFENPSARHPLFLPRQRPFDNSLHTIEPFRYTIPINDRIWSNHRAQVKGLTCLDFFTRGVILGLRSLPIWISQLFKFSAGQWGFIRIKRGGFAALVTVFLGGF